MTRAVPVAPARPASFQRYGSSYSPAGRPASVSEKVASAPALAPSKASRTVRPERTARVSEPLARPAAGTFAKGRPLMPEREIQRAGSVSSSWPDATSRSSVTLTSSSWWLAASSSLRDRRSTPAGRS